MKKIGVLRFPGTNCDADVFAMVQAKGYEAQWLWHQDHFSSDYSALVIPGGFSYGDYLRCGALAARSPAMTSVREQAKRGVPILGICNGFQILCESGLLPGVLVRNIKTRFVDHWVELSVVNSNPYFAKNKSAQTILRLPIAHGEGRFTIEKESLKRIWDLGQVWLTYKENPNGSQDDIAGVSNKEKNVCALMPHPERALYDWMGGKDGWEFL